MDTARGDGQGATPPIGEPVLRWSSRTHTIDGIEAELARIWSSTPLTTTGEDGAAERHVAEDPAARAARP